MSQKLYHKCIGMLKKTRKSLKWHLKKRKVIEHLLGHFQKGDIVFVVENDLAVGYRNLGI